MFCTFQCITIYIFQRVAPTIPPGTTLVSSFSQNLRFELNILNLALGGISVLHKTKYTSFWRAAPPRLPASEIHYCD